jgi:hypothetical protein
MVPVENRQLDEGVWQAWLSRNRAQETMRGKRRLRMVSLAAAFLVVGGLMWRLTA